jgi:hypothetical protein
MLPIQIILCLIVSNFGVISLFNSFSLATMRNKDTTHNKQFVMGGISPNVLLASKKSGKTRAELGESKYIELVVKAKQAIEKFPSITMLSFPIGTNNPIKISKGKPSKPSYKAIGFMSKEGKPAPILVTDLIAMFDGELKNKASSQSSPKDDKDKPSSKENKDKLTIDLIVQNIKTKKTYLVKNINFEAFTRDAINASLNNKVVAITQDFNQIKLDKLTITQDPNLNDLNQKPLSGSQLMESIQEVSKKLETLADDIPLTFPAGTDSPIKFKLSNEDDREISNDNTNSEYDYIGFADNQNRSNVFTVKDASDMLRTAYSNNGILSVDSNSRQTLITDADAQNLVVQAKRIPVFAMFLRNRKTGKRYFVKDVNANAVFRDLLNAALNGTLRNMTTGTVINLI